MVSFAQPTPAPTKGVRIAYLDGIRGIAALAVVILHASEMYGLANLMNGFKVDALLGDGAFSRIFPLFYEYGLKWGVYAVQVFIVLSGYTLMLAIVRSLDGRPKGGVRGYFSRRIRRIWPPYYASLCLSLLMIAFIPGMNGETQGYWTLALPALAPEPILAHAFFLQNWTSAWYFKINPPLWTIAVEEQIYILFPLLLLPFWRRFGNLAMIAVAALVGIGTVLLWPQVFDRPTLWFLVLFALGAAGASISFSPGKWNELLRNRVPWLRCGIAILVLFLGVKVASELGYTQIFTPERGWLEHSVFGAGIACLLVHFTQVWQSGDGRRLPRLSPVRWLQFAPVETLGIFSYSLYLIHSPILAVMAIIGRDHLGLTGEAAYIFILTVGVAVALAGAYAFHLLFERPFMPHGVRTSQPLSDWLDNKFGWRINRKKAVTLE